MFRASCCLCSSHSQVSACRIERFSRLLCCCANDSIALPAVCKVKVRYCSGRAHYRFIKPANICTRWSLRTAAKQQAKTHRRDSKICTTQIPKDRDDGGARVRFCVCACGWIVASARHGGDIARVRFRLASVAHINCRSLAINISSATSSIDCRRGRTIRDAMHKANPTCSPDGFN